MKKTGDNSNDTTGPETGSARVKRTDAARIQGIVEPGTVSAVLRLLRSEHEVKGVLRIRTLMGEGEIWVDRGTCVSATFGAYFGRSAVQALLKVKAGEFAFTDEHHLPAPTLNVSLASILDKDPHILERALTPAPPQPADDDGDKEADTSIPIELPPEEKKRAVWSAPASQLGAVVLLMLIITGEAVVLTRTLQSTGREKEALREALREQQENVHIAERKHEVYAFVTDGNALMATGDLAAALTNFAQALELRPSDQSLQELVDVTKERLMTEGRQQTEAEAAASRARRQASIQAAREHSIATHIANGDTARDRGDLERALAHYREAFAAAPDHVGLPSLIAATEEQLRARRIQAQLQARTSAQEAKRQARVGHLLTEGDNARRRGDTMAARKYYTALLALEPNHAKLPDRLNLLGAHLNLCKDREMTQWWSTDLAIASTGVASFDLPNARSLDILVTATSGPLRFGHLNAFGVAYDTYYEPATPSPDGQVVLPLDGRRYRVSWQRMPIPQGRRYTYVIAVGLLPATTASTAGGPTDGP